MVRKTPHIRAEIVLVGHGYQLDLWDYTWATQDGNGIRHYTECHDVADSGPSICSRAEQSISAICKAMRAITGATVTPKQAQRVFVIRDKASKQVVMRVLAYGREAARHKFYGTKGFAKYGDVIVSEAK